MSTPKKKPLEKIEDLKPITATKMVINRCAMCGSTEDVKLIKGVYICNECEHKFYNEIKYADDLHGIHDLTNGVKSILNGLSKLYGINPNSGDFINSHYRVARALLELNYGTDGRAAKDVLNVTFDSSNKYNGLISCNNIRVFSMCPHHLLPIQYSVSLAYCPSDGRCLGLSKLPRLVKLLAKRMELQETFTNRVVDTLDEALHPMGCACQIKGIHGCVQCRGGGMIDMPTVTIALRGIFLANSSLKTEWLHSVQNC